MQNRSQNFSEKLIGACIRASLVIAAVLFVWGDTLAAQSARTAPPPPSGSIIVYRDIPTRPAQATGTGETLTVNMAPNEAFVSSLELGIVELDDAQAALITSSSLQELNRLIQIGTARNATGALTRENPGRADLPSLDFGMNTSSGSLVSGSISVGVAPANTAVGSVLSSAFNSSGGGR